jgi:hypothetical protein
MASIINTTKGLGVFAAPKVSLTGTDTLTFVGTLDQELILYNITASPVVVTIDGAGGTTVVIPGTGGVTASVASGLAVTVPANDFQIVRLQNVSAYLQGAVAVTGGVGVVAAIIQ